MSGVILRGCFVAMQHADMYAITAEGACVLYATCRTTHACSWQCLRLLLGGRTTRYRITAMWQRMPWPRLGTLFVHASCALLGYSSGLSCFTTTYSRLLVRLWRGVGQGPHQRHYAVAMALQRQLNQAQGVQSFVGVGRPICLLSTGLALGMLREADCGRGDG